jgi:hypothetical protein
MLEQVVKRNDGRVGAIQFSTRLLDRIELFRKGWLESKDLQFKFKVQLGLFSDFVPSFRVSITCWNKKSSAMMVVLVRYSFLIDLLIEVCVLSDSLVEAGIEGSSDQILSNLD